MPPGASPRDIPGNEHDTSEQWEEIATEALADALYWKGIARAEREMHTSVRRLANSRIRQLCSTVNTLAGFRKVQPGDFEVSE
jgi:hypothetical protein